MRYNREIFFSPNCDEAADKIGGYQRLDDSLIPVLDALEKNPYGFPKNESDWYSYRAIITKPFQKCPSLLWIFYIETSGNVVLDHVEEYERYLPGSSE